MNKVLIPFEKSKFEHRILFLVLLFKVLIKKLNYGI